MNKEKHIVMFSGGKDSTEMLCGMIDKNMRIDEILTCDTGKEFPQMYQHIKKVEEYIKIPITILKADKTFEYYMFDHIKTKGKRKGECGYGWCTGNNRWCTQLLKKAVTDRYLNKYKKDGYKVIEYHGIAFDEQDRIGKNKEKNIIYPLNEWKTTEKEALQNCYNRGFDWGGLYEIFNRVSCWCCPLSNLQELYNLYIHFPSLWIGLKEMDKHSSNQFRLDYTLDELEIRFGIHNEIKKILERYDLNISNKLKKTIIKDLKNELITD